MIITDEMVEVAARAIERHRNPWWDDDQFDIWWNRDPVFVTKKNGWGNFNGTRKEKLLFETRLALETALTAVVFEW